VYHMQNMLKHTVLELCVSVQRAKHNEELRVGVLHPKHDLA
jgi:hypothetical protein